MTSPREIPYRSKPRTKGGTTKLRQAIVVGGGPVGLTTAIALRRRGIGVTLLERRDLSAPTTRDQASFNLTLVRPTLAQLEEYGIVLDDVTVPIRHRMFWQSAAKGSRHRYGYRQDDTLYGVERGVLLERCCERAREVGVDLQCGTNVVKLDARSGRLLVETAGRQHSFQSEVVLCADGVNSGLRDDIVKQADCELRRQPDGFCYSTVRIDKSAARGRLDLDCIHFVPGRYAIDIAIGNRDGSFSLLLERQERFGLGSIASLDDARRFGEGCPPILRDLVDDIDAQILASPIRRFKRVACGCRVFGCAVLLGDAASTLPPYLGKGANDGIGDVTAFVRALDRADGDWERAAQTYELQRRAYRSRVDELDRAVGKMLLNGQFGGPAWRFRDRLDRMLELICGYRSSYQRLVFDTTH